MDVWTLPAAIFFGTMGMFAGVAAMYLTVTRAEGMGCPWHRILSQRGLNCLIGMF